MSEHVTSRAFYLALGIGLLVLTAVTVFAAFVNLGPFNPVIALLIATIKATLVILFFMHVKYEASWKYVLTIPASIMSIFLVLALVPDVGRRYYTAVGGRTVAEERLQFMAEPKKGRMKDEG